MSFSLVFKIADLSSFSAQTGADLGGALLLFADNQGRVAAAVGDVVGKDIIGALTESSAFRKKRFAVGQTLFSPLEAKGKAQFRKLIVVNVGDADEMRQFSSEDWLKLGGVCRKAAADCDNVEVAAAFYSGEFNENALKHFICGFKLGNYRFDKYKTNKPDTKCGSKTVTLRVKDNAAGARALDSAKILADSVILARDLVNEPANILGTNECVAQIRKLADLGVKIDILSKQELEREGLNALLAVAQGSKRPPYLAVMRWNGDENASAEEGCIALIGKGVVFDSGGISIKPSGNMEEMKGDMGGAAAVIGAIHALAARKAKLNVIGVVGLVENMPDAEAQRPGDIVTSMSGQTIEIVNTDAEGRLVLADALWFTKEKFKPRLMIDFATLTGAICVALGEAYAGLFANNADLSKNLLQASAATGELLWSMPLAPAYDKKLKSRFADMRNSCGRDAGAVTAAQFLQRFVDETPWAHIDIAGTAFGTKKNAYNKSWATGFGVRLIDEFARLYEK